MLWSAPSPSLCLSWHTDTLFDQGSPCSSREHLKRAQHYMSMVLLRGRAQEEAGVSRRVEGFRHHLLLYSLEGPSWILCKDSMRRVSPSPPDSSGCSCCLCLCISGNCTCSGIFALTHTATCHIHCHLWWSSALCGRFVWSMHEMLISLSKMTSAECGKSVCLFTVSVGDRLSYLNSFLWWAVLPQIILSTWCLTNMKVYL